MTLIQAGQYAGALIAIFTLLGMFVKWGIVKPIKAYIDHATYPIQPNSNGGKSLPDLIEKVDAIQDSLNLHLLRHEYKGDTPK